MRNTRFGLFTVVATLVVAMALTVNCGGGGSSPTEPPKPTPTPVPVQPSISLSATTPDCGATIPSGGSVKVRVYIVAGPGNYSVGIRLLDASGKTVEDNVDSPIMTGTGFYDLVLRGPRQPAITMTMVLSLDSDASSLATQTNSCGFTWQ